MKNEELLEKTAPCSLVCYTCAGYEQGIICESAKQLLKYLEGVREFYEKNYPDKIEKFCIFEEEVYLQWLEGNEEIKFGGIREYWKKSIENPHYKQYRKI